jgi:hypothetical protein
MGFDLYGIKAINKKGEYFRNNVWGWRPLWNYICNVGKNILTNKDMEEGEWNNGHTINATKTKKLVEALEASIKNKTAKTYAEEIKNESRKAAINNVDKEPGDKNYDWANDYPFTISNLKEFIVFAKNSGGFKIW